MVKKSPYNSNKLWIWNGNAYLEESKLIRHDGLNSHHENYFLRVNLTVSLSPNTQTEEVSFRLPLNYDQYNELRKEYINKALKSKKEPKIMINEGKLALLLKKGE